MLSWSAFATQQNFDLDEVRLLEGGSSFSRRLTSGEMFLVWLRSVMLPPRTRIQRFLLSRCIDRFGHGGLSDGTFRHRPIFPDCA